MAIDKKKAQENRKKYDAENMSILAAKLPKAEAEAFRALAEERGTTVSRMLATYVRAELSAEKPVAPVTDRPRGEVGIVSYKNVDRLKHEVAFHNPDGLNPDGMLNRILDRYFRFVDQVRV